MREVFDDLFNRPTIKTRVPSIKHYEWVEDGQRYSSWKIDTGTSIIHTGDAGKALFDKAIEDDLKKNYERE